MIVKYLFLDFFFFYQLFCKAVQGDRREGDKVAMGVRREQTSHHYSITYCITVIFSLHKFYAFNRSFTLKLWHSIFFNVNIEYERAEYILKIGRMDLL